MARLLLALIAGLMAFLVAGVAAYIATLLVLFGGGVLLRLAGHEPKWGYGVDVSGCFVVVAMTLGAVGGLVGMVIAWRWSWPQQRSRRHK